MSDQVQLVLTAIGQDQPGIVRRIARTVADEGANWLESRMARLASHFAGIVLIEVAAGNVGKLTHALEALEADGLRISVQPSAAPEPPPDQKEARLELVGYDRPGIVRQITDALATHGVNIEELETSIERAAMTGDSVFRVKARLRLAHGTDLGAVAGTLEQLGADLMVDITLTSSLLEK